MRIRTLGLVVVTMALTGCVVAPAAGSPPNAIARAIESQRGVGLVAHGVGADPAAPRPPSAAVEMVVAGR
jgi:hypothetical protein